MFVLLSHLDFPTPVSQNECSVQKLVSFNKNKNPKRIVPFFQEICSMGHNGEASTGWEMARGGGSCYPPLLFPNHIVPTMIKISRAPIILARFN